MFAINVPLGVVAFAFAWRLITQTATGTPPPLDRVGVVLTCGALGAITYAGQVVSDGTPQWTLAILLVGRRGGAVRRGYLAPAAHAGAAHQPAHAAHPDLRRGHERQLALLARGRRDPLPAAAALPDRLRVERIKSGSVVLFVFVGNIAIKPATTWLFNRFGFRTMLLASTTGLAATAFAAGLLTADTPLAVVVLVAVLSGVARSVGLTGYTTLGLSDVPAELMRDANALASTVQQLFSGLGVAAATVALRIGADLDDLLPGRAGEDSAFTVAFALLGLAALVSTLDALRLHPRAGEALVEAPAR